MSIKQLDRLMFAQGGLCFFCKQSLPKSEASVEHLFARANGGDNNDDNCVACCKALNSLLGCMSLKEKIQVLLNQKGKFNCPNGVAANNSNSIREAVPKSSNPTLPKDEQFNLVIDNLKQRGNSRPRTLKTLSSTIVSLFQKNLTESELKALIQRLQSSGKIIIVENKVSYVL